MWQSTHWNLGVVLFSIGAGAWFAYFRLKEAHLPSSFLHRLLALCGGLVSIVTAFVGFQSIDALGFTVDWATLEKSIDRAVVGALTVGFVEEAAKMLPVLILALLSQKFRRASEGLVLSACAGVGFATAENLSMLAQGDLDIHQTVARAIAAPLTHALFAAPWGLGLGLSLLEKKQKVLMQGFFLSVVAHGLYNLLLARPEVPQSMASLVVLSLWIWLLVYTRPASPSSKLMPAPIRAFRPRANTLA